MARRIILFALMAVLVLATAKLIYAAAFPFVFNPSGSGVPVFTFMIGLIVGVLLSMDVRKSKEKRDRAAAEAKNAESMFSFSDAPIHLWFSLSYANYMTLPRSLLQSMPVEWQSQFVELLERMHERLDYEPPDEYMVRARGRGGKFVADPYARYDRGRRRIPERESVHHA